MPKQRGRASGMGLPTPTSELVLKTSKTTSEIKDTALDLDALTNLFVAFPENRNDAQVLAKVVVLNRLYATQIFNVRDAARQIVRANIDRYLARRSIKAVTSIAEMNFAGSKRSTYSFASKYCSWHQPKEYPIYDQHVARALVAYQDAETFSKFTEQELLRYGCFRAAVCDFIRHYKLKDVSLLDVDRFLMQLGRRLKETKSR